MHTRGTLSVTVIPAVGSADGPVSLAGETVILRRPDGTLIGDTTAPGKAIFRCPLSDLPLERVDVSFGERAGPRSLVDVGAYSLLVEYRIDAERGLPDWVLAETDRRYLGPLLCPRGFSGPRFPLCTGIVPRFDVVHPGRDFLDCIADGPGCFSLHRFDLAWPLRFDLDLTVTQPVQISLLDVEGATLAQNVIYAPIDHKQLSRATLAAPKMLETGTYFLKVEGPPSRISVSLPLDQRADSVTPLPKRPWRLIIIVAFVLVALLAFVVIWQRVRRKSG